MVPPCPFRHAAAVKIVLVPVAAKHSPATIPRRLAVRHLAFLPVRNDPLRTMGGVHSCEPGTEHGLPPGVHSCEHQAAFRLAISAMTIGPQENSPMAAFDVRARK